MGLETATYITGLVETNPLANDFIREADDHMRLIKSVLKNTFPNANAPINATPAELNLLVGQTGFPGVAGVNQQVQFNSSGNFAGSSNLTFDGTTLSAGALSVAGAFVAGNYTFDTNQIVGAGQDNFVLTYNNGSGEISLEAVPGASPAGSPTEIQFNTGGAFDSDPGFTFTLNQLVANSYVFDIDQTVSAAEDNYVLTYDDASGEIRLEAPASGGGDVFKVGTPVDRQLGVWTGDGTIEGDPDLTYDTSNGVLQLTNASIYVDAGEGYFFNGDGDQDNYFAEDALDVVSLYLGGNEVYRLGITDFEFLGDTVVVGDGTTGEKAYEIDVDTAFVRFGGGASGGGAKAYFWGGTHATKANDFELRAGVNNFLTWDESVGQMQILTGSGAKTLAVTINSTQNMTLAGNLVANSILPNGNDTYDIGASGLAFRRAYLTDFLRIDDTSPQIRMQQTNGGVDQKWWFFQVAGEGFEGRIYEDALSNNYQFLNIERSGTGASVQVDTIDFTAETHIGLGNFLFDITQTVGAGQDNFVLTYDDASGLIGLEAAAGGGGGSWVQISSQNVSGSPSQIDLTWDESIYINVKVVIEGIQPATDGVTFRARFGSANGGTIYNSTNDYDGMQRAWEGTGAFSALADSTRLDLAPSSSNASNETIDATIDILCSGNADLGAALKATLHYINSSSDQRVLETKAFLDDGINAAIDTIRLYFAAGNFANVGTIKLYGLTRT